MFHVEHRVPRDFTCSTWNISPHSWSCNLTAPESMPRHEARSASQGALADRYLNSISKTAVLIVFQPLGEQEEDGCDAG